MLPRSHIHITSERLLEAQCHKQNPRNHLYKITIKVTSTNVCTFFFNAQIHLSRSILSGFVCSEEAETETSVVTVNEPICSATASTSGSLFSLFSVVAACLFNVFSEAWTFSDVVEAMLACRTPINQS